VITKYIRGTGDVVSLTRVHVEDRAAVVEAMNDAIEVVYQQAQGLLRQSLAATAAGPSSPDFAYTQSAINMYVQAGYDAVLASAEIPDGDVYTHLTCVRQARGISTRVNVAAPACVAALVDAEMLRRWNEVVSAYTSRAPTPTDCLLDFVATLGGRRLEGAPATSSERAFTMAVPGFSPARFAAPAATAEDVRQRASQWLQDAGLRKVTSRLTTADPGFDAADPVHVVGAIRVAMRAEGAADLGRLQVSLTAVLSALADHLRDPAPVDMAAFVCRELVGGARVAVARGPADAASRVRIVMSVLLSCFHLLAAQAGAGPGCSDADAIRAVCDARTAMRGQINSAHVAAALRRTGWCVADGRLAPDPRRLRALHDDTPDTARMRARIALTALQKQPLEFAVNRFHGLRSTIRISAVTGAPSLEPCIATHGSVEYWTYTRALAALQQWAGVVRALTAPVGHESLAVEGVLWRLVSVARSGGGADSLQRCPDVDALSIDAAIGVIVDAWHHTQHTPSWHVEVARISGAEPPHEFSIQPSGVGTLEELIPLQLLPAGVTHAFVTLRLALSTDIGDRATSVTLVVPAPAMYGFAVSLARSWAPLTMFGRVQRRRVLLQVTWAARASAASLTGGDPAPHGLDVAVATRALLQELVLDPRLRGHTQLLGASTTVVASAPSDASGDGLTCWDESAMDPVDEAPPMRRDRTAAQLASDPGRLDKIRAAAAKRAEARALKSAKARASMLARWEKRRGAHDPETADFEASLAGDDAMGGGEECATEGDQTNGTVQAAAGSDLHGSAFGRPLVGSKRTRPQSGTGPTLADGHELGRSSIKKARGGAGAAGLEECEVEANEEGGK